jgi:hypothetical protein
VERVVDRAFAVGDRSDLGDREQQLALTGRHVDPVEPGVVGRVVVGVRVDDALVAVACTRVVEPLEVDAERTLAIGRDRVDRMGKGALFVRLDVEDACDEVRVDALALAIVPHHLAGRAGQPLQHGALLPVECARRAERDPLVVVLEIDHADLGDVVGGDRAVLEIDGEPEHPAVAGAELQLVVVAEPVEVGAVGQRAQLG